MAEQTSSTQQKATPPLRELRRERGLTVEQVAVLAGVDKATISRYERGLHQLSPQSLVRLSKALRVPVKRITG
jgi:transcriptional regulator with XRE-family HTH domain